MVKSAARRTRNVVSLCLVVAWCSASAQPGKDIYIETEVQPPNPYVQQQSLFILRVFTTKALNGSVTQLKPQSDVVVKHIGKMKRHQANRHGRKYQMFEQRSLFFVLKSGAITFAPIVLTGHYVENNQRFKVREQAQPMRFNVLSTPASFPGGFWLPAKSMHLEEKWSEDPSAWRAGDPITRMLIVRGRGVAANQIPEIEWPELPWFKVYPDKARLDERIEGEDSIGERRRNVVIIPSQPGRHTLPAIRVPWWNTTTNRLEYAELPARDLEIAEAAEGAVVTLRETSAESVDFGAAGGRAADVFEFNPWVWVSTTLATAWLATIAFFYRAAWRSSWARLRGRGQPNLRARRRRLKKTCLAGDVSGTSRALVDWARLVWTMPASATIASVAEHIATTHVDDAAGDDLQSEIAALDRALYGGSDQWSGDALWRAFGKFSAASSPPRRRPWRRPRVPAPPKTGSLETLHKLP